MAQPDITCRSMINFPKIGVQIASNYTFTHKIYCLCFAMLGAYGVGRPH